MSRSTLSILTLVTSLVIMALFTWSSCQKKAADVFKPCHRVLATQSDNLPGNGMEVFGANRLEIDLAGQIGQLKGDQCLSLAPVRTDSLQCSLSKELKADRLFSLNKESGHLTLKFERPEVLPSNQILQGSVYCTTSDGVVFTLGVMATSAEVL